MSRSAMITLLVFFSLLHAGCSRLAQNTTKSYATVVVDTQHDPELTQAECERAARLFEKGHWEKAEAALQDALIADVTYAPAHSNLGLIYFQQGKLYLAAWEFEYARRLLPDSAEVASNLGMVYEAANQPERAIEYYGMAVPTRLVYVLTGRFGWRLCCCRRVGEPCNWCAMWAVRRSLRDAPGGLAFYAAP